jgi:hypothetical protein
VGRRDEAAYRDLLQDNPSQAVQDANAVLQSEPGNGAAYAVKAYALANLNDPSASGAVQQAMNYLDRSPRVKSLVLLAQAELDAAQNADPTTVVKPAYIAAAHASKAPPALVFLAYAEYLAAHDTGDGSGKAAAKSLLNAGLGSPYATPFEKTALQAKLTSMQ